MSVKSFNLIADTEISMSQEHWEGCLDETNTGRREKPKGSGISKEDKRANLFTMSTLHWIGEEAYKVRQLFGDLWAWDSQTMGEEVTWGRAN